MHPNCQILEKMLNFSVIKIKMVHSIFCEKDDILILYS